MRSVSILGRNKMSCQSHVTSFMACLSSGSRCCALLGSDRAMQNFHALLRLGCKTARTCTLQTTRNICVPSMFMTSWSCQHRERRCTRAVSPWACIITPLSRCQVIACTHKPWTTPYEIIDALGSACCLLYTRDQRLSGALCLSQAE